MSLEVGRQVDDVDSVEWALLRADTTANAEPFRDEGNLGLGSHFDAKLACPDDRTRLFTFLPAFLVRSQDGGMEEAVWTVYLGLALLETG